MSYITLKYFNNTALYLQLFFFDLSIDISAWIKTMGPGNHLELSDLELSE